MPTNSFFNNHFNVSEQDLIEDLTVEYIQISGMDLYYIPREYVDEDYLYNEDPVNAFNTYHIIEFYLKSVDGFGADLDIITDFGLELNESATWEVSKKRFKEEVLTHTEPREGDLLYIPMTKSLMEIKKVKPDDPFYQRGKNYVYEIVSEMFEYSQEDMNTGVAEIDDLVNTFDTTVDINNDPSSDNDDISTEGDGLRTFDESDPFGDY